MMTEMKTMMSNNTRHLFGIRIEHRLSNRLSLITGASCIFIATLQLKKVSLKKVVMEMKMMKVQPVSERQSTTLQWAIRRLTFAKVTITPECHCWSLVQLRQAECLADFVGEQHEDLSFEKGDFVYLIDVGYDHACLTCTRMFVRGYSMCC